MERETQRIRIFNGMGAVASQKTSENVMQYTGKGWVIDGVDVTESDITYHLSREIDTRSAAEYFHAELVPLYMEWCEVGEMSADFRRVFPEFRSRLEAETFNPSAEEDAKRVTLFYIGERDRMNRLLNTATEALEAIAEDSSDDTSLRGSFDNYMASRSWTHESTLRDYERIARHALNTINGDGS